MPGQISSLRVKGAHCVRVDSIGKDLQCVEHSTFRYWSLTLMNLENLIRYNSGNNLVWELAR